MRSAAIVLSVIVPIALTMLLGYFFKRRRIVSAQGAKDFNKLVFKCFLPASLFMNVVNSSFHEAVDLPLILLCVIGTLTVFALCLLLVPRFEKDPRRAAIIEQAIYRGNYVIFGLVVVEGFFPGQVGMASVVSAFLIPCYNILAVVLLENASGGRANAKKLLRGVATNPLVLSTLLGLIVALTGLKLPAVVKKFLQSLASMSSPAGLLAIGMGFEFSTLRKNAKALTVSVVMKLVVLPVIFSLIGLCLGMRDAQLIILLIAFGAPTAVSSYSMAQMYDVDHDLASHEVVATTLCCVVSLSLLIWLYSLTPYLTL